MNPMTHVDVLTDWVRTLENHGMLLSRSSMNAPWGMHIPASPTLVLHLIQQGDCWVRMQGLPDLHLQEGDLLLVTRGSTHQLSDLPDREVVSLAEFALRPPPEPDRPVCTLVCSQFQPDVQLGRHLVKGLPEVVFLSASERKEHPSLDLAVQLFLLESAQGGAGSDVLIRHLLDAVLIYLLRHLMQQAQQPGWWMGASDPQVSRALLSMHGQPDHAWTVEGLAEVAGLSRAAFARRFAETVGEPPLAYLTLWRMHLAARLLHRKDITVYQVAHQVGYTSEASFSRAFKRQHGVAPQQYRSQQA